MLMIIVLMSVNVTTTLKTKTVALICPHYVESLDSDSDGIRDTVDFCMYAPETYNSYQDEDGCPDDTFD